MQLVRIGTKYVREFIKVQVRRGGRVVALIGDDLGDFVPIETSGAFGAFAPKCSRRSDNDVGVLVAHSGAHLLRHSDVRVVELQLLDVLIENLFAVNQNKGLTGQRVLHDFRDVGKSNSFPRASRRYRQLAVNPFGVILLDGFESFSLIRS